MISEIIIPDLGATGGDVVFDEWLVQPGDRVTAGQPLFIIVTDKATVEVEAFMDGVLREIQADPGTSMPPGTVVALLADRLVKQPWMPLAERPLRRGCHPQGDAADTRSRNIRQDTRAYVTLVGARSHPPHHGELIKV